MDGPFCLLDCGVGASQHRINGGKFGVERAYSIFDLISLPFSDYLVVSRRGVAPARNAGRRLRSRLATQAAKTVRRQRPARWLRGYAPAGAQHVAGDCELMGGCANIAGGVMENEVFEMNQFTIDPQRCARVGEVRAFDKTLAHGRTGNALVEPGQCRTGV
ncbi:hypothetical protein D3C73_1028180 [compost metagenome]